MFPVKTSTRPVPECHPEADRILSVRTVRMFAPQENILVKGLCILGTELSKGLGNTSLRRLLNIMSLLLKPSKVSKIFHYSVQNKHFSKAHSVQCVLHESISDRKEYAGSRNKVKCTLTRLCTLLIGRTILEGKGRSGPARRGALAPERCQASVKKVTCVLCVKEIWEALDSSICKSFLSFGKFTMSISPLLGKLCHII